MTHMLASGLDQVQGGQVHSWGHLELKSKCEQDKIKDVIKLDSVI